MLVPPEPKTLRHNVEHDANTLYLALADVTFLIGAVGIANTTLVSILERTGEIGLRRTLGAARRHIAAQFLAESATLSTLGGIAGTLAGLVAAVAVAAARQWAATIPPMLVALAPLAGTIAGIYPALRATTIQPLEALRTHD